MLPPFVAKVGVFVNPSAEEVLRAIDGAGNPVESVRHLNFDLGLAKQQSEENPVYYLQYAHARIASIIRNAESQGIDPHAAGKYALLKEAEEIGLLKELTMFPDIVESCAATFEPHRLAEYLHTVAGAYHKFYHEHRVLGDDRDLTAARIALCLATKTILANGFAILGITAPEKM